MKDFDEILEGVKAKIAAACQRAGRDPGEVEIIAVTKTHGAEVVKEAWDAGLRIVGENKVQEAAWKKPASVTGPLWHLIGHLQSNKVRKALELFDFFHSVDSAGLADRMNAIAQDLGASHASFTTSAPCVFVTAMISTSPGSRPTRLHAAAMRDFTSLRIVSIGFID